MDFQSIKVIAAWGQWILAAGIAIVTFRCVYIIFHMANSVEENNSGPAIMTKITNHVKAVVIMLISEGLVELVKSYFFH